MKKLGNLKLNYLAKSELDSQEMNLLVGGQGNCCCSCWAADMEGGSKSGDNHSANDDHDLRSIYGCDGGDSGGGDDGGGGGSGSPDWTWQALGDQYCTC